MRQSGEGRNGVKHRTQTLSCAGCLGSGMKTLAQSFNQSEVVARQKQKRESRGTKSSNLSAGLMDDTRGNREWGEGTRLTKAFIRASADSTSQAPGTQKWEAERSMGKLSPDGPGTMERDGKKLTENTWAPDYWSHPSRPRERPSPPTGNGRGEGRVLCPLLPCTCALAKRLLNPPASPGWGG